MTISVGITRATFNLASRWPPFLGEELPGGHTNMLLNGEITLALCSHSRRHKPRENTFDTQLQRVTV